MCINRKYVNLKFSTVKGIIKSYKEKLFAMIIFKIPELLFVFVCDYLDWLLLSFIS